MVEYQLFFVSFDDILCTYTVKPPNNGHIGTTNFVRYTEVSIARRVQRSRAYLMS